MRHAAELCCLPSPQGYSARDHDDDERYEEHSSPAMEGVRNEIVERAYSTLHIRCVRTRSWRQLQAGEALFGRSPRSFGARMVGWFPVAEPVVVRMGAAEHSKVGLR